MGEAPGGCRFRDEALSIIAAVSDKAGNLSISSSKTDGANVSRGMMLSILRMVDGAFAAIEVSSLQGARIISRSILEHVVDHRILSFADSNDYRRRFLNFHKIILYQERKSFEVYKEEIPRLERDYRNYVRKEFSDRVAAATSHTPNGVVEDWSTIDKYVQDKSYRGWSGKSFDKRVNLLVELQSKYRKITKSKVLKGVDCVGDTLRILFGRFSEYAHPTGYSCLPHFDPRSGAFLGELSFTEDAARKAEHDLLLFTDYCISSFAVSLGDKVGEEFLLWFRDIVTKSPDLNQWLVKEQ